MSVSIDAVGGSFVHDFVTALSRRSAAEVADWFAAGALLTVVNSGEPMETFSGSDLGAAIERFAAGVADATNVAVHGVSTVETCGGAMVTFNYTATGPAERHDAAIVAVLEQSDPATYYVAALTAATTTVALEAAAAAEEEGAAAELDAPQAEQDATAAAAEVEAAAVEEEAAAEPEPVAAEPAVEEAPAPVEEAPVAAEPEAAVAAATTPAKKAGKGGKKPAKAEEAAPAAETAAAAAAAVEEAPKAKPTSWLSAAKAKPTTGPAPVQKVSPVPEAEPPVVVEAKPVSSEAKKKPEAAAAASAAGSAAAARAPRPAVGDRLVFNVDRELTDDEVRAALGAEAATLVSLRNLSKAKHVVFMDFSTRTAFDSLTKRGLSFGGRAVKLDRQRDRE